MNPTPTRQLDAMARALEFLTILERLIDPEGELDTAQRIQLAWLMRELLADVHAGLRVLQQRPRREQ